MPVLIADIYNESENKFTIVFTFGNNSSQTEVTKKYEKVLTNSTKSFVGNEAKLTRESLLHVTKETVKYVQ